jgi:hypothetical protein
MRSQNWKGPSKVPISRGSFFDFWADFHPFSQFRGFLDPIFLFFAVFSIPRCGILDPRSQPCVVAHPEQELKRANWAPKVTIFIFVYLGIKPLVSFSPIRVKYWREV